VITVLKGIDIFHGQGKIDWTKVKGIDFVIMKAGEGRSFKDTQFENNYAGCKAVGLPVGAYQFSRALNAQQAKEEAEFFLSLIKGKKFEFPCYYDMEWDQQAALPKAVNTEIAATWINTVKAAGYMAGLYTNPSWYNNHFNPANLPECEWWIAQWASSSSLAESKGGLWQYTDKYWCEGIGYTDGNYSYKNYAANVPTIRESTFDGIMNYFMYKRMALMYGSAYKNRLTTPILTINGLKLSITVDDNTDTIYLRITGRPTIIIRLAGKNLYLDTTYTANQSEDDLAIT
jgi:hypothetical protein